MSEHAKYDGQSDHQVNITKRKEVVSINYGNGRKLTICFIDFGGNRGTIDIARHDDSLKTPTDDGRSLPWFPFLAFCTSQNNHGQVEMGTSNSGSKCTLLTLPYDEEEN